MNIKLRLRVWIWGKLQRSICLWLSRHLQLSESDTTQFRWRLDVDAFTLVCEKKIFTALGVFYEKNMFAWYLDHFYPPFPLKYIHLFISVKTSPKELFLHIKWINDKSIYCFQAHFRTQTHTFIIAQITMYQALKYSYSCLWNIP